MVMAGLRDGPDRRIEGTLAVERGTVRYVSRKGTKSRESVGEPASSNPRGLFWKSRLSANFLAPRFVHWLALHCSLHLPTRCKISARLWREQVRPGGDPKTAWLPAS